LIEQREISGRFLRVEAERVQRKAIGRRCASDHARLSRKDEKILRRAPIASSSSDPVARGETRSGINRS
jgi:hypothetical protein